MCLLQETVQHGEHSSRQEEDSHMGSRKQSCLSDLQEKRLLIQKKLHTTCTGLQKRKIRRKPITMVPRGVFETPTNRFLLASADPSSL